MILDLMGTDVLGDNVFYFRVTNPIISINFDVEWREANNVSAAQVLKGIMIVCKNSFDDIWHNVNLYISTNQDLRIDLSVFLDRHELVDVIIYGPSYYEMTKLMISCEDGLIFTPEEKNKISVIGGTDSFGRLCTTNALKFSSILQRKNNNLIRTFTYDEENYLPQLQQDIKDKNIESDIIIMELNKQTDTQKAYEIIKTLEYKHLVLWYYNYEDDGLLQKLENTHEIEYIASQEELTNSTWQKPVIILPIKEFDTEYFDEFCTLNNEYLTDTGNIMLYQIIQEFFDGVIK